MAYVIAASFSWNGRVRVPGRALQIFKVVIVLTIVTKSHEGRMRSLKEFSKNDRPSLPKAL